MSYLRLNHGVPLHAHSVDDAEDVNVVSRLQATKSCVHADKCACSADTSTVKKRRRKKRHFNCKIK